MIRQREKNEQVEEISMKCFHSTMKLLVFPTGGKSVAERAKLFGPQIKSTGAKTTPIQPKFNNFPPSNRDYQPLNNGARRGVSDDYAP